MKKLISLLMLLMMTLTSFAALAEEAAAEAPVEMSLFAKGMIVTVVGLAGVFLVLVLFFLTIKMMQKMLK